MQQQHQNLFIRTRSVATSRLGRVLGVAALAAVAIAGTADTATATSPCGALDECKALIEINASDGDIGFHFLMDGDDLTWAGVFAPDRRWIYIASAQSHLKKQNFTETFVESSEPLCWFDPEGDPDDVVVTLEDFLDRWPDGDYLFKGIHRHWWDRKLGKTELTYELPAAPTDIEFDGDSGVISWAPGDDLGECADVDDLDDLVDDGILPVHPQDVEVAVWEVVFEADDGSGLKFAIRVPADQFEVTVPAEYLDALPEDTPAKIEVGAIGLTDNATFTEEGDICVNEVEGCEEED